VKEVWKGNSKTKGGVGKQKGEKERRGDSQGL
jgi:hypothetical protein